MKPALLDTNVLLALAWPNHQSHDVAHEWFRLQSRYGWASCALTQVGFIRLSSNPAFTALAVTPSQAAALLRELVTHKKHSFWPSPAADSPALYQRALGHQQVNDAYLVEVATRHRGRLVTLDTKVAVHAGNEGFVWVIGS